MMRSFILSLCLGLLLITIFSGCEDSGIVSGIEQESVNPGVLGARSSLISDSINVSPGLKGEAQEIPGQYIIVFKRGTANVPEHARSLVQAHGGTLLHTYQHTIQGFAANLSDQAIEALRRNPNIDYVEPDKIAFSWAQAVPNGIYKSGAGYYDANGTRVWADDPIPSGAIFTSKYFEQTGVKNILGNVNVYIIDTGVDTRHTDLNVVNHVNFAGGRHNTDCEGHGTHVAGTVAAEDDDADVIGVAPGAHITGVRVLDCFGRGSASTIIAGVDWVTANAKLPAVANMSLGLPATESLDQAVRESAAKGIFYAVAAGNDDSDACLYSPARAGVLDAFGNPVTEANGIMTVGAVDANGVEASFSNDGKCVEIWAPGVGVGSTILGGGIGTNSGTSMASPHVAGGGALYFALGIGNSAVEAEKRIKADAKSLNIADDLNEPMERLWVAGFAKSSTSTPVAPVASFTATPTSGTAPLTVSFDASSSTGSDLVYSWDFGNTQSGSGVTVTHTYSSPGTYTAKLTVSNSVGSSTESTVVTVGSSSTLTSFYVTNLVGSSTNQGGSWTAQAIVTLQDDTGQQVKGATFTASWDLGSSDSFKDNLNGTYTFTKSGISKKTGSATFRIDNITYGTLQYVPSDGKTAVTVYKP